MCCLVVAQNGRFYKEKKTEQKVREVDAYSLNIQRSKKNPVMKLRRTRIDSPTSFLRVHFLIVSRRCRSLW